VNTTFAESLQLLQTLP